MVCSLVSIYFDNPQLGQTIKTLDYWSRDMLNFNISEKGLGLVSPPHFVYDFSRKLFHMLHSVDWPNFLFLLPLLLEILVNVCIAIVCQPGCDVIKLEANPIFFIKPFCYMTKKSDKNLNTLRTKRAYEVK